MVQRGQLSRIRWLVVRLGWNKKLTAFPPALCRFPRLEELHLSHCQLESVPEEIGGLVRLRILNLSGNKGLGSVPAGVGGLPCGRG